MRYVNKVTRQRITVIDEFTVYDEKGNVDYVSYERDLTVFIQGHPPLKKFTKPKLVFHQFYVPEDLWDKEHL